jgi:hypothetical protein
MKGKPGFQTPRNQPDAQPVFRVRRGKKVQVPPEWMGHTVHEQTKQKRQPVSRRTRKEHK